MEWKTMHEEKKIDDFRCILNTRKMLKRIGSPAYDGPDFTFDSRHHPSPAKTYVKALAMQNVMRVIIPNCLLAKKYGYLISINAVLSALKHTMTAGKSDKARGYWEEFKNDPAGWSSVISKFNFYVANIKSDGTPLPESRRCYFDKYVNIKFKDAPKMAPRTKAEKELEELLEKAKERPELNTMSHRQLMAEGITDRLARRFMKARGTK